LEWISYVCIGHGSSGRFLFGLPTYEYVELVSLEITDETKVNYLLFRSCLFNSSNNN